VIIRLDKSFIPVDALLKIANRLKVEYLAQEVGFTDSILAISEEIDSEWWAKNGEEFLKNVKK